MPQAKAADGTKLYYESQGSGPAIIFVHELAGTCHSFDLQVAALKGTYRCITFNARGDPPADVPAQTESYTQDIAAEDIGAVLDAWGRIDIVINNAADLHARGILEEDLASFNRAVTVAAAGNFLFTKHAAIAMIERGIKGSIVSILSSNAWQGAAGFIAYAFHKGGLANFVRAAAMDLAPYGIRVNSFSPTAPRPDNPELLAAWRAEGRTSPPRPVRAEALQGVADRNDVAARESAAATSLD